MPPRGLVLAALISVACPAVATAQGFFESLFGGGASTPPPRMLIPYHSYRTPIDLPHRRDRDPDRSDTGEHLSGHYRTLCVRMCDGYYWPISQSAPRSRFYRDAGVCRSACGEEARLFYLQSS